MTSPQRKKSSKAVSKTSPNSYGYSGTPLLQKLGIKPNARMRFVSPPAQLPKLLGPLPAGASATTGGQLDFALLFVEQFADLTRQFGQLRHRLESNGMLWVAWPKKTSGVVTDLNENIVREFGLNNGLADVKVCAIDDTWSGLKFVRRLSDR